MIINRNSLFVWITSFLGLVGAFILLLLFSRFSLLAIFSADLLLCLTIILLLPEIRYRWILLLYPLVMLAMSLTITDNWFNGGDGLAHTPEAEAIYLEGFWGAALRISTQYNTTSIFDIAKVMSPGAALGFQIPFHFFNLPTQKVYQNTFILSQGFVYICLVCLITALIRHWKLFEPRFSFIFILFLVLSPTALSGCGAPNRHMITMASVSMLLVTHIALLNGFTLQRFFFYSISIVLVILSKAPLLIPYFIFSLFSASVRHRKRIIVLGSILIVALITSGSTNYFFSIISSYNETRVSSMRMLGSGLMDVPVIGWIIKYIYAVLSPFPWYKMDLQVESILSGSYFLFFLQTGSSLTGLYYISVLILKWRVLMRILKEDLILRYFILFGSIMSTSILAGGTGYHVYIAIFFPFLAPIIIYKELRVHVLFPVMLALLANFAAFMVDISLGG